jgi:hypothetical protein
MPRIYLVGDPAEIARRRKLVAPGSFVEAWPDLHTRGDAWLGEASKLLLDAPRDPLPARLSVDGALVPVYYGPRLCDVDSLPAEESIRSRVLSAHGIAAAWITLDAGGARAQYQPQSPEEPVFFLRRPGGNAAHLWRLFRSREEAVTYMREYYGRDPEGTAWAESLPAASWDDLIERHATKH